MEKYRGYADTSTGVNPFVPLWSNTRRSWVVTILRCVPALPLTLLKLTVSALLCFVTLLAYASLCPIAFLSIRLWRGLQRLLVAPLVRMVLWSFGVVEVRREKADSRRLQVRPCPTPAQYWDKNSVIFSTFTSFVDVLLLIAEVSPVLFVIPTKAPPALEDSETTSQNGHRHTHVALASPWDALRFSLGWDSYPVTKSQAWPDLLSALECAQKTHGGPLVVLGTGRKHNGAAIYANHLQQGPQLTEYLKRRLCLVAISYPNVRTQYSPPHTIHSWFKHFSKLCYEWSHPVLLLWAPNHTMSQILSVPSHERKPIEAVRTALERMSRGSMKKVDSDGAELAAFARHFDSTQKQAWHSKIA